MASTPGDIPPGDYATFTFVNSSYTSNYIAFRPYEAADRSGAPLQTVPSNYSAVFSSFGGGYPFLDFANAYVAKDSLLAFPNIIGSKNWTSILTDVSTSDSVGLQIREAANLITGVICRTLPNPGAVAGGVCSAPGVSTSTQSIAGPTQASLAASPAPPSAYSVGAPEHLRDAERSG
jgi:hypothetical protein